MTTIDRVLEQSAELLDLARKMACHVTGNELRLREYERLEAELVKEIRELAPQDVTLYAVHQGDDDQSPGNPRWWFTCRQAAEGVAEGRGWYGGNAPISAHRAVVVGGRVLLSDDELRWSVVGVGPDDEAEIAERAEKKLSRTELAALRRKWGVDGQGQA